MWFDSAHYEQNQTTNITTIPANTWTLVSVTFLVPVGSNYCRPFVYGFNGTMNIAYLKLEKGNKATDWSSAPEDVAQDAQDRADSAQTVAQTYATTNCVKTDASNAPSTIKNSTVSIGSDGTLNNAGGGKVTIGGLGYTGALDATKGAPTGTYVGSTLAQTVESNASNALTNAAKAQSTADGKITTFYQTSAPTTGMSEGDIWFDTDDSNKIYTYQSGTWKLTRDSGIAQAINAASAAQTTANTGVSNAATAQSTANNAAIAASTAQTTANKKVETYFSTTEPTTTTVGDLWYNTSTSLLKRWDGSSWAIVSNSYTNTSQLTDGANLGGTSTWSGVTGSGKPADNATVGATWGTNLNNQPTQLSNINSSEGTKLSGIAAGATVGATWGSNITGIPSNLTALTGSEVINNATAQDNLAKQMGYNSYSDLVSKAASSSYGTICVHGYLNTALIQAQSIDANKIITTTLTSLGNVTAGSFNIGSGKFVVDVNGNLTATNASITGNITATTGKIGQWTIDSTGLSSDTVGTGGGTIKVGDQSTHFVNINDNSALISVRADADTGISIYTQNVNGVGLSIMAQAYGTAIKS